MNYPGGYRCLCNAGYSLASDKKRCRGEYVCVCANCCESMTGCLVCSSVLSVLAICMCSVEVSVGVYLCWGSVLTSSDGFDLTPTFSFLSYDRDLPNSVDSDECNQIRDLCRRLVLPLTERWHKSLLGLLTNLC